MKGYKPRVFRPEYKNLDNDIEYVRGLARP